jgi:hypothetical protein
MKKYILIWAAAGLFFSGMAIGAANPFNPSGTFGQSYMVLYDASGNQLGTNANPVVTQCQ